MRMVYNVYGHKLFVRPLNLLDTDLGIIIMKGDADNSLKQMG